MFDNIKYVTHEYRGLLQPLGRAYPVLTQVAKLCYIYKANFIMKLLQHL